MSQKTFFQSSAHIISYSAKLLIANVCCKCLLWKISLVSLKVAWIWDCFLGIKSPILRIMTAHFLCLSHPPPPLWFHFAFYQGKQFHTHFKDNPNLWPVFVHPICLFVFLFTTSKTCCSKEASHQRMAIFFSWETFF